LRKSPGERNCRRFLRWCARQGLGELSLVQPVHVAAHIETLQAERSAPTVKQHLAGIRMLFDWLVTGQVIPSNPPHTVRGPRYSVSAGTVLRGGHRTARQHEWVDRRRPARPGHHCRDDLR
jgi:site-specific recombinase XerD